MADTDSDDSVIFIEEHGISSAMLSARNAKASAPQRAKTPPPKPSTSVQSKSPMITSVITMASPKPSTPLHSKNLDLKAYSGKAKAPAPQMAKTPPPKPSTSVQSKQTMASPKPSTPLQPKNPKLKSSSGNAKPSPQPSPSKRKLSKPPAPGEPQKTILDFFKTTRNAGNPGELRIFVRKDLMANAANTTAEKRKDTHEGKKMKRFKTMPMLPLQKENDVSNITPQKMPSEMVTLSPGIKKRMNRFKSVSPEKPPPTKKLFIAESESNSVEVVVMVPNLDPLYFMIAEVKHNQSLVERFADKAIESLLSEEENEIIQVFLTLTQTARALFTKRFFGRENWHRVGEDSAAVKELSDRALVITCIDDISLSNLLTLLKKEELTKIFKKYTVSHNTKRKEVMVEALLRNARTQKSAFAVNSVNREVLIRRDVTEQLGAIYKVSPKSRVTMSRVVLLFSTVFTVDDESKRAESQRYFVSRILKGEIKFPVFELHPAVLFETRSDFIEYESALKLRMQLDKAFEKKSFEDLETIAVGAKAVLEKLLKDIPFMARFAKMPSFLKRYNAGSVLTSVLTHYCERFKKKHNLETVTAILKLLLEQPHFGCRRRGKWYDLLCQAYLTASKTDEAVNILTVAKMDPSLNDVMVLTLLIKAQRLKKQKKFAELLSLWNSDVWEEPASIEINGQALSNVPGSKLVYVQKTADGARYSSVEEHAIAFYKSQGYQKGMHAEGFIVSTIFSALFFDIIYSKVPGVFLSPFQDRPLDFYSSTFFANREDAFNKRLNAMTTWTVSDAAEIIKNCFEYNRNAYCVISWSDNVTSNMLTDIIACLGIPALKTICERFIYQPHLARSGFPDLTLWDMTTKKCKFVEVKSPKDTLMPNQRVWLSYLKGHGIDCEVCNVRNVASKPVAQTDSLSPVE